MGSFLGFIFFVNICGWTDSLSVQGEVSYHNTFYYQKLSSVPSKVALISYNVSFGSDSDYVNMHIHTTDNHVNLNKQCSYRKFGQAGNANLHRKLTESNSRECYKTDGRVICSSTVKIQDYVQRYFGFSFEFDCNDMVTKSLRDLVFNVTIHGESNKTKCLPMPDIKTDCRKYYSFTTLPNLIGHMDPNYAALEFRRFERYPGLFLCYQPIVELNCHAYFPRCDALKNHMIVPCRESCHEFFEGCMPELPPQMVSVYISSYDCDYLPSVNGDVPCFYRPVTCASPPHMDGVLMRSSAARNGTYLLNSTAEFFCPDKTSYLEGGNTIRCRYNGNWSQTPTDVCAPRPGNNSVKIVVPVVALVCVVLLFLLIVKLKRSRKSQFEKVSSTRLKDFDAFVSYSYEGNCKFAEETLRIELEENRNPNFKLCIHRRDFLAAWDIMWNIRNAIQNSNSAIIVMSQDYVNSLWCKEEFEQCYMENMKDPAFKMFVIMLQEEKTLKQTSEYMKSFFTRKTYLERQDPKLFSKIADYLSLVKDSKSHNRKGNILVNCLPNDLE